MRMLEGEFPMIKNLRSNSLPLTKPETICFETRREQPSGLPVPVRLVARCIDRAGLIGATVGAIVVLLIWGAVAGRRRTTLP